MRTYFNGWEFIYFFWAILFIILFLNKVYAQLNCADAPTSAAKIVCEQLHSWDKNTRVRRRYFI